MYGIIKGIISLDTENDLGIGSHRKTQKLYILLKSLHKDWRRVMLDWKHEREGMITYMSGHY